MNWGTMRGLIRTKLNDPLGKIWPDSELLIYANMCLAKLAVGSEANLRHALVPLVSGTRAYEMNSDFYELRSARMNGYKLWGTTPFELEQYDTAYLTNTGTPEWYYNEDSKSLAYYRVPSWTSVYTGATFDSEFGVVTEYTDGTTDADVTSEFGITIDAYDTTMTNKMLPDRLLGTWVAYDTGMPVADVSYVYVMPDMVDDSEEPAIPGYMAYAVIYFVASECFGKSGQGKNETLEQFYSDRFKELKTEWFSRNLEWAHGHNQFFNQVNTNYGNDLEWRQRVWR